MKLKCWVGNLDGSREAMVISTSQVKACKAVGTQLTDFRRYYRLVELSFTHLEGRTHVVTPFLDRVEIGMLYTRPIDRQAPNVRAPWEKGRCILKRD